jgi:hypothetical protein
MSPVIASILAAALPSVINLVEKLRGSKTGAEKFADVFSTAIALLQTLAARGVGPKEINDNDVKALIETLVQSMKNSGTLQETRPAAATLLAGRSLRVKVEEILA